jgi:ferrochelatase
MEKKKIGVLLVNLGTPDTPLPADVRRYLIEFLTDGRVIDSPWIARQLLVRTVIVPRRYRQSAAAYRTIWTPEGSPLKVYGKRIEKLLQEKLGDDYLVALAMRYRFPSIESGIDLLMKANITEIIIVPMFPQYASATTGSIYEKVMDTFSKKLVIPKLTFIDSFATHPGMIKAFCAQAKTCPVEQYDHILFSFHGLPQRQLIKADEKKCCQRSKDCCQKMTKDNARCYAAQCHATAYAIADEMGLRRSQFSLAFQSRLGKEPWIEPYTSEVIIEKAKEGVKKMLVFCPSFVCDCLETTSEIGDEYGKEFVSHGGEKLDLVPGLNDHPEWINALASIVKP